MTCVLWHKRCDSRKDVPWLSVMDSVWKVIGFVLIGKRWYLVPRMVQMDQVITWRQFRSWMHGFDMCQKILQLWKEVAYTEFTCFSGSVYVECCNRMYSFLLRAAYKVSKVAIQKKVLNTGRIAPFWVWLWVGRRMCACGGLLWVWFLYPVLSTARSKCSPFIWPVRHLTLEWCSFHTWLSSLRGAHVQCLRYLHTLASAKSHSCFQM